MRRMISDIRRWRRCVELQ